MTALPVKNHNVEGRSLGCSFYVYLFFDGSGGRKKIPSNRHPHHHDHS